MQANLRATSAQRATATDQVSVARQQVAAAQQQVAVAQAVVKQRQADLDNAKLQLSYTTLVAPGNGIVSKKNVQPGQVVAPGQQLMGLVASEKTWVIANFKETQPGRHESGPARETGSRRLPQRGFPGSHRVALRRHRRPLCPAAPRQRQRQLRESDPARARKNCAG
ncbi:efflux RND transporter periplasmic adaptor subunit [Hymenobacter humi]|uniref:Efflux RND transporter periplasmic adaptor subunit n=1 Tax=Hymenobacter humi TaxID=1411620 RepID=A0ABW2TZS2_9BACT